jgi:hypothetical protein
LQGLGRREEDKMLIDDIISIIEHNGFAKFQVNMFADNLPDSKLPFPPGFPPVAVAVYGVASAPDTQKTKDQTMAFSVQVRGDYINSRNVSNGIYNLFDNGESRLVIAPNGRKILVKPSAPPLLISIDEGGRCHFVYNMTVVSKRD